jgi:hypothetical protein
MVDTDPHYIQWIGLSVRSEENKCYGFEITGSGDLNFFPSLSWVTLKNVQHVSDSQSIKTCDKVL